MNRTTDCFSPLAAFIGPSGTVFRDEASRSIPVPPSPLSKVCGIISQ